MGGTKCVLILKGGQTIVNVEKDIFFFWQFFIFCWIFFFNIFLFFYVYDGRHHLLRGSAVPQGYLLFYKHWNRTNCFKEQFSLGGDPLTHPVKFKNPHWKKFVVLEKSGYV